MTIRYVLEINGCHDCPFYSHRYCSLAQYLQHKNGPKHQLHVVNEWHTETMPKSCPIKHGVTITPATK